MTGFTMTGPQPDPSLRPLKLLLPPGPHDGPDDFVRTATVYWWRVVFWVAEVPSAKEAEQLMLQGALEALKASLGYCPTTLRPKYDVTPAPMKDGFFVTTAIPVITDPIGAARARLAEL